eukprot:TRINITY_DN16556_c0_g2_i1.p1 TRINITY_DN16556_c0_g2~~TRINITY_DN16556_c0_g2_i1.p1  ORF type:complete len:709 (+),score=125.66 TRINITY_DN16556_c0_g2_i1:32-2158(+)
MAAMAMGHSETWPEAPEVRSPQRLEGVDRCPSLEEISVMLAAAVQIHERERQELCTQVADLLNKNKELATKYWDVDREVGTLLEDHVADAAIHISGDGTVGDATALSEGKTMFPDEVEKQVDTLIDERVTGALEAVSQVNHHHGCFIMRDMWQPDAQRTNSNRSNRRSLQGPQAGIDSEEIRRHTAPRSHAPSRPRCIRSPGSRVTLAWDLLGGTLIFLDCILIPLSAFDPPRNVFIDACDWFSLIFWTLNVPATLTSGYVDRGVTVVNPRKILVRYLTSWFIVDTVVLIPDWVFSIVSSSQGQSLTLIRVFRMIKTIRFLRLLKIRWINELINDMLDSEATGIMVSILKMVMLLLMINHFIACAFFLVANLSLQVTGESWVTKEGFDTAGWGEQYVVAFHWSITQFTPASMHVQPQNIFERVFAVAVVVFALVGFSYVVGSITSSLAQLRSMSEHSVKEFWKLRRFLRQNAVPAALTLRIKNFVERRFDEQKHTTPMSSVSVLKLLSDQMMDELLFAIRRPDLDVHPLFLHLCSQSKLLMHRICGRALKQKQVQSHEYLFMDGEQAECMYFMVSGTLLYDKSGRGDKQEVEKDSHWLCEAALWCSDWEHCGYLVGVKDSSLLSLAGTTLASIVGAYPLVMDLLGGYAVGFVEWLNKLPEEMHSDLVEAADFEEAGQVFAPEVFTKRIALRHSSSTISGMLYNMFKSE